MEYVNQEIENRLVTDVDVLKYKAIKEYMNIIYNLERGRKINHQNVLELMSLIDIYSELDTKRMYYKQFYLNE